MKQSFLLQKQIDLVRKEVVESILRLMHQAGIRHIDCDLIADGDENRLGTDIRCELISPYSGESKITLRSITLVEDSLSFEMETCDNYMALGTYRTDEIETESGLLPILRYIENLAESAFVVVEDGEAVPADSVECEPAQTVDSAKPAMADIAFHDDNGVRCIRVTLTNGHVIEIGGIDACGQKTFAQSGGTMSEMYLTLPIARRCTAWLHGAKKRPDLPGHTSKK